MVKSMELRVWRHLQGWTLHELAEKAETTYATISRYERRNRKTIRSKMVDKIFKLSRGDVTANDLYGHSPEVIAEMKVSPIETEAKKLNKNDKDFLEKLNNG